MKFLPWLSQKILNRGTAAYDMPPMITSPPIVYHIRFCVLVSVDRGWNLFGSILCIFIGWLVENKLLLTVVTLFNLALRKSPGLANNLFSELRLLIEHALFVTLNMWFNITILKRIWKVTLIISEWIGFKYKKNKQYSFNPVALIKCNI